MAIDPEAFDAFDAKEATADTSVPEGAVLFGADSQSAASPSVYPVASVAAALKSELDAIPPSPTTALSTLSAIPCSAFGIFPDLGTDQSTAFMVLRTFLQANRDRHITVYFPPGLYEYTNNRLFVNVGRVTLLAHGAEFRCTNTSDWDVSKQAFRGGLFWSESHDIEGVSYTVAGDLIKTVAAGETTIQFVTAGDSDKYSVGERVLIHGYNQQDSGFPPNLRFFQWAKVAGVNAGEITIDQPLRYEFRDDWRDHTSGSISWGAARVVRLDRADYYYPEYIEIVGATLSSEQKPDSGFDLPADTLVLRNCKQPEGYIWPAHNRIAIYEDCEFDDSDLDKIVDECYFRRCTFKKDLSQASGINKLVIENVTARTMRVAPRILIVDGLEFRPTDSSSDQWGVIMPSAWPVESARLRNVTVHHRGNLLGGVVDLTEDANKTTILGVGENNEIVVAGGSSIPAFMYGIAVGTFMFKANLTNFGRVTRIHWDGTNYLISGTWAEPPVAGEEWFAHSVQKFDIQNVTLRPPVDLPIYRKPRATQNLAYGSTVLYYGPGQIQWSRTNVIEPQGFVRRITCHVVRPYTGAGTASIDMALRYPSGGETNISVDLKTVGVTESRVDGVYSVPNKTVAQLDDEEPTYLINLYCVFQNGAPADPADMPVVTLEVEVIPVA